MWCVVATVVVVSGGSWGSSVPPSPTAWDTGQLLPGERSPGGLVLGADEGAGRGAAVLVGSAATVETATPAASPGLSGVLGCFCAGGGRRVADLGVLHTLGWDVINHGGLGRFVVVVVAAGSRVANRHASSVEQVPGTTTHYNILLLYKTTDR